MKDKILKILKNNKDKVISGEQIAKELNITRSYVSKTIKELTSKGYNIKSENRIGYIYLDDKKILNKEYIESNIKKSKELIILEKINSTNTFLKELAKNKKLNNVVAIAEEQTSGRGRLGRTFVSNRNQGIYMSILIRPNFSIEHAKKITCLACVATSKAIEKLTGLDTKIKWVNDIYINNKKLCGILTEGSTLFELGVMEYVIIGIGINCYKQDFGHEINNIATSIEDETNEIVSKNDLIIEIVNQLDYYLDNIMDNKYMDEYISKSFVIGKKVLIIQGSNQYNVEIININNDGELIVKDDNNIIKVISSGEITKMVVSNE